MAVRLVDGNEIVDTLKQIVSDYTRHGMYPSAFPIEYAIGLVEKMPTITPPNEWVSVEERLPENNAQVLMWSAKWNIAEAGSYYNGRFWVYSEIGDGYIADDITHWMSLPAPPERLTLDRKEDSWWTIPPYSARP